MRDLFSRLWQFGSVLLGLAVFAGLMWYIARAHSHMWRQIGSRYSGSRRANPLSTKLETFVIAYRTKARGLRSYGGLMMAVHRDGLSAWLIPPLNVMTRPLFLPFKEMSLAETDWGLWDGAFALRMSGAPDVDIIITKRTLDWIREQVDEAPFGFPA